MWRETDRFINSGRLNWRPKDYITAHATVGLDYTGYSDESFNAPGQGCAICGQQRQGLRAIDSFRQYKYSVDLGADLGGSANFDITDRIGSRTSAGAQYNEDLLEGTLNSAFVFPPGGQSIDAGATKNSGELTIKTKTVGTYLEQQLSWDDRIYVTGAMRVDQNSAFGEGFEAAWYPKASVSFIAMDDPGATWISSLRLRGAFGQSGLQPDANAALRFLLPVTSSILQNDQGVSVPSVTIGGSGGSREPRAQARTLHRVRGRLRRDGSRQPAGHRGHRLPQEHHRRSGEPGAPRLAGRDADPGRESGRGEESGPRNQPERPRDRARRPELH